ncbi:MAG TPA: GDSL-type esterase/lipase family protein [Lunatimonas sp.]|nr:GDSL-type esterase/lipase family protein [Lunatimonas sp.]
MKKANCMLFLFLIVGQVWAQNPTRFESQVKEIREIYPAEDYQGSVVFTGSSSIRMWADLATDFPNHKVVNAGFGGSQAVDLLHYVDELILAYRPKQVFIYEGDNDISAGKDTEVIMETLNLIVSEIKLELPETEIILIGAKPSISRWELADKYTDLNTEMVKYSAVTERVQYADVWTGMLGPDKKPLPDIFLEDNLHMKRKGYEIWAKVIGKFLGY